MSLPEDSVEKRQEQIDKSFESTVSDIKWLRVQRRLAVTDADRATVSALMKKISQNLDNRAEGNPLVSVISGFAVIIVGLLAGYFIYLLADAMWMWLNS
ncbi:hypothetical protein [Corynebacterium alimapuense]|nr:hypothetical protein [Corynebacterium alimapuense]